VAPKLPSSVERSMLLQPSQEGEWSQRFDPINTVFSMQIRHFSLLRKKCGLI
jgi:hypothetical protein